MRDSPTIGFCLAPTQNVPGKRSLKRFSTLDVGKVRVIAGGASDEISQVIDFTAEQDFGDRQLQIFVLSFTPRQLLISLMSSLSTLAHFP